MYTKRIVIFFALFTILIAPAVAIAAGIVPCDATKASPCNFSALLVLARNVLNFLVTISVIISAVMFAYAGWLFFSDAGSTKKIAEGKKIFSSVALGLVIILIGWVLVNTILLTLTGKDFKSQESSLHLK